MHRPFLSAWFAQNLQPELEQFTALHNHELDVDPEVYYSHSWKTGDPI
jgi:hypothetical protein